MQRLTALKTREKRGRESDEGGQYPRRTSARWASSTVFPRANGDVLAVRGDVVRRLAQKARAEVNGEVLATTWPGASATLAGRALACVVHVWACLGVHGLVRLVHEIVESMGWHDQGSG